MGKRYQAVVSVGLEVTALLIRLEVSGDAPRKLTRRRIPSIRDQLMLPSDRRDVTTASTSDGRLDSAASAWGGTLRSRRVWEVMGPMEMRRISCGRLSPATSSNARRFVAVDELVKVIAAGQRSGEENRWRTAAMESEGTTLR